MNVNIHLIKGKREKRRKGELSYQVDGERAVNATHRHKTAVEVDT